MSSCAFVVLLAVVVATVAQRCPLQRDFPGSFQLNGKTVSCSPSEPEDCGAASTIYYNCNGIATGDGFLAVDIFDPERSTDTGTLCQDMLKTVNFGFDGSASSVIAGGRAGTVVYTSESTWTTVQGVEDSLLDISCSTNNNTAESR